MSSTLNTPGLMAALALGAGLMMVRIGTIKQVLERRRPPQSCAACGRTYPGRSCPSCTRD